MQNKISTLAGIILIIIVIVIAFAGVFAYEYSAVQQMDRLKIQSPTPPQKPQKPNTAGWQTYSNAQYGFSFQYPATLASTFAQFAPVPTATVSPKGSAHIDSKGCYKLDIGNPADESTGAINGMAFCESSGGDPGAGQLYSSYYYTTLVNANYITLEYIVHTPNGCDNYMGTANYQNCMDFFNNYTAMVLAPIHNSVATLTFTNSGSITCTTQTDCPSGDSCMTEGPIIANQPAKKVCVPPGQALPL